jgi:hypothetical protein
VQERLDLGEAAIDPDDGRRALGQQVIAEAAPAIHLDEQAAELGQRLLARLEERAPLAPEDSGVRSARADSLNIGRAPAKERGHIVRV